MHARQGLSHRTTPSPRCVLFSVLVHWASLWPDCLGPATTTLDSMLDTDEQDGVIKGHHPLGKDKATKTDYQWD